MRLASHDRNDTLPQFPTEICKKVNEIRALCPVFFGALADLFCCLFDRFCVGASCTCRYICRYAVRDLWAIPTNGFDFSSRRRLTSSSGSTDKVSAASHVACYFKRQAPTGARVRQGVAKLAGRSPPGPLFMLSISRRKYSTKFWLNSMRCSFFSVSKTNSK